MTEASHTHTHTESIVDVVFLLRTNRKMTKALENKDNESKSKLKMKRMSDLCVCVCVTIPGDRVPDSKATRAFPGRRTWRNERTRATKVAAIWKTSQTESRFTVLVRSRHFCFFFYFSFTSQPDMRMMISQKERRLGRQVIRDKASRDEWSSRMKWTKAEPISPPIH